MDTSKYLQLGTVVKLENAINDPPKMTCTPFLRQKSKKGGAIFMEFKYSYEEKFEAVLRIVNDGMSVRESARILGASPANVHMWRELYLKNGPDSLKYKRKTYEVPWQTS